MASKRERQPGVWELKAYVGRDHTGKERYRTRRFRGGPREAEKALNAFAADVEQAKATAPASGSLGDLLERWLAHARPDVTDKTFDGYRRIADRVIADIGDLQLGDVTPKRLDTYYRELLAENLGTKEKPRHRTALTVHHYHAVIRQALGQGARWGDLTVNPATLAKPPKVHRREIDPPSPAVADKLVRALARENPDLAAFIFVALATGMRRGELVALRWSDVNLEAGTARVHRALSVVAGKVTEKDTKTHQARIVALDPATVAVLEQHRARMDGRAAMVGVKLHRDPVVFTDDPASGKPWNPDLASHRWARFVKKQGHPGVRLHDLRHAMATSWLDAGVPVHVVSQRLGHAKVSTTTDIYAHVPDGSQAKAAAAMAASLPKLELGREETPDP